MLNTFSTFLLGLILLHHQVLIIIHLRVNHAQHLVLGHIIQICRVASLQNLQVIDIFAVVIHRPQPIQHVIVFVKLAVYSTWQLILQRHQLVIIGVLQVRQTIHIVGAAEHVRVMRLLYLIFVTFALMLNRLIFIFFASLVQEWRVGIIEDLLRVGSDLA